MNLIVFIRNVKKKNFCKNKVFFCIKMSLKYIYILFSIEIVLYMFNLNGFCSYVKI